MTPPPGARQDQAGAGWQDHCVWFAEGLEAELDTPGRYPRWSHLPVICPQPDPLCVLCESLIQERSS